MAKKNAPKMMRWMCDSCNRVVVSSVSMVINVAKYDPLSAEVRETFGKLQFYLCPICWLKGLGVKPLKDR